ncbi:oligosaccharide flippase family protein [Shewanella xiamenensis]|uniref:lipopolysaccharide biosynthesis protein n=1 Tax=Shewanella xiamenensis TaxID=332186 RepID=UPI00313D7618
MLIKLLSLYSAQLLKVVLPLLFIPLIINLVGIEQYGLVSFLMLLISLLGLIDAGISGGMVRLISTTKDNLILLKGSLSLWSRVLALVVFLSILIAFIFFAAADLISLYWIKSDLDESFLKKCLNIIGIITALTFIKGYLISKVVGYEKHVQLSAWQALIVASQYIFSYVALIYINNTIEVYLYAIAVFTIIDCIVVLTMGVVFSYKNRTDLLQSSQSSHHNIEKMSESEVGMKQFLANSVSLSSLTIIWTLASQADKIILSSAVDIETFSYYQIAAQVSLCINLLIMPLNQYLMPRLSSMYAAGQTDSFTKLWFYFLFYFSGFLAFFSPLYIFYGQTVIELWLGDEVLSDNVHIFLRWLFFSAIFQAVSNFLFIYYYAINKLNKQLVAYLVYCVLTLPCVYVIALFYGAEACSIFVMFSSFVFLSVWGGISVKYYIGFFQYRLLIYIVMLFCSSALILYAIDHFFGGENAVLRFFMVLFLYGLFVLALFKMKLRLHYFLSGRHYNR